MGDLDVSRGVGSFLARGGARPWIHGVGVHLGRQERGGGARHQAAGGAGGSGQRREDEIDLLGAGCYERAR